MKMRRLIGLFVAAAFAAGSTAVHATIKLIDPQDSTNVKEVTSVIYAKETLSAAADDLQTPVDSTDTAKYYKITGPLTVSGKTKVKAALGEKYFVSYVLDGMVLAGKAEAKVEGNPLKIVTGGVAGSKTAVFELNLNAVTEDKKIQMTTTFAIQGEGSGSITMTETNLDSEGIPGLNWSETRDLPGAVRAISALKERITPEDPTPIAMSAYEFMAFFPSSPARKTLTTSLGTIQLSVMKYHDAQKGAHKGDPVKTLNDIAGKGSSVEIAGDFSFVDKLNLGEEGKIAAGNIPAVSSSCPSDSDDLRKTSEDDPSVLTDDVMRQDPTISDPFGLSRTLCLTVDGETSIPVTDPYTVTTKYKGRTDDAAFPPVGATYDLAGIERDGTSYHIPYLTTYEGYNQRFSIVNRRSGPVAYNFGEFRSEDGVTTTPGMKASGMLAPGQTVLTTSDIVEITGGFRASATLSIVAPNSSISAAVQQVNRMTRTVDTVYLVHGR